MGRHGAVRTWRKVKISGDWQYGFSENDAAYNLVDDDPNSSHWFDYEETLDFYYPGQANAGYKLLTGKDPRPSEAREPVRVVEHHRKALKPKRAAAPPSVELQEQPAIPVPSFTPAQATIRSEKLDKFKEQELIEEIAALLQQGRSLSDACTIVWRVANNEGYNVTFRAVEEVWQTSTMSQFVHFLGDAV